MTRYGSVLVGWFMLVLVDAAGSPHGRGAAWLCGTALQANLYTVLFKFNNFRNLDVWLQSPERTRLLQELIPLVDVKHIPTRQQPARHVVLTHCWLRPWLPNAQAGRW